MTSDRAAEFDATIRAGGVVLFPSDTVYGLACDPENEHAIDRLYAIKRRPLDKAAAVMFFSLTAALDALPDLGVRTLGVLRRLMPGAVTVLLPNAAHRFPLACRADPGTLGVRIVDVPVLRGAQTAVLQSSANPAGGRDSARLTGIAQPIVGAVDLVIDGGELPGTASTVVDLRAFEEHGRWSIVRHGAVDEEILREALVASQQ